MDVQYDPPMRNPDFEVDWEPDDPENPRNWSIWYRSFIVGAVSFSTTCVILYSTSYTSGVPGIQKEFGIESRTMVLLGLTTYLLGLAAGCLILAPLSEMYGRRLIYLVTTALFAVLMIPVALAPNLAAVLVSRVFSGFFGSATIASAPGTVNDVVSEKHRALAFSLWSLGAMNGPVLGPIIGGFVYQYLGWRWTNWVVLVCAGVSLVALAFSKETYAPAILRAKTQKKQKETEDLRWWSRHDTSHNGWKLLRMNLARPFSMAVFEPICLFWNLYVGVVYAVLFLCFVGYPIVFEEERGWSPGLAGLGYCGIGVGVVLAVLAEPLMRTLINLHPRDPLTGQISPEASVSPVCIGSILIPIGEIWFSWTARPSIHWIWPILAGVPFGLGNGLVFIYATNYLAGSYTIYAASALAGNSMVRYIFGGVLPLAGSQMYHRRGSEYSGTMLALLEIALIPIPLVFYRYGWKIRQRSPIISRRERDRLM
ncbi:MFS transporter [Aspergillus novofumigatus IBT 16806]|uniref:Synaptic vesicle transporter n=1 Tax=Aspergillus novofumigatus (strain IBT 16806) TaxID=1392255 RepID=A0A2I1BTU2_ASPN1|nr:synaptic vesicle transporter [Aspergillus novofumigatus IBT 16806]PKX88823.1 synaptic vesicle transporter [Aspergillus novofumigatus IBT 16806]